MNFKDLLKEENKELTEAYGLIISANDVDFCDELPSGLEDVGLLFAKDSDGLIDEALLDVIITLRVKNIGVVLEVDYKDLMGDVDLNYLLQLANNTDISIAILPNENYKAEEYSSVMSGAIDLLLQKPNFDKFLYPVSNFLEYLMLEQIIGKESLVDFRPESKFIVSKFSEKMQKEDSDAFKAIIRKKVHDFYDGEDNFKLVAATMIEELMQKGKGIYKDNLESHLMSQISNQSQQVN